MISTKENQSNWDVKTGPSAEFFKSLHDAPPLLATLLWNRGITSKDEIEAFLNPDYEKHIHDPLLFRDMKKAIGRITEAIANSEKIIIFGDYDADGVCGAAVLNECLKKIGALFEVHIPDRSKDGFGLSEKSVRGFNTLGAKLLITIDCGVTDYNEIELANSLGIDVIILDHHLVPPRWPNAFAIIDHKHPEETYPEHVLSGAGLAYKLVQALARYGNFGIPNGWEKWLLDLVAIAAIADMVPLKGENRSLTHYGLRVLRKARREGLKQMFAIAGKNPLDADTETISHFIAPRINAASRMDHAHSAFLLLTTENEEEARHLARRLEGKNEERKVVVESILENLEKRISPETLPAVIFEGSPEWPAGVLGLAATRLVERYSRPVFLYSVNDELIKGSCRAPAGMNVVELMTRAGESFSDFGGHTMSGGFSVLPEHLREVKEKLESAGKEINVSSKALRLEADCQLALDNLNNATFETVSALEPFGQGNPRPSFFIQGAKIADLRKVGPDGNHLKMKLGPRYTGAIYFRALQGRAPRALAGENGFRIGDTIDVIAELSENIWNGSRNIELRIIDARHAINTS